MTTTNQFERQGLEHLPFRQALFYFERGRTITAD